MKIMSKLRNKIKSIPAILWFISLSHIFLAIPSFASDDSIKLTGHEEDLNDAAKQVTGIVVGKFTDLGSPAQALTLGEKVYAKAAFKVSVALKGKVPDEIKVRYAVSTYPPDDRENKPVIGVEYIAFVEEHAKGEWETVKLMLATDANLAAVKAVIANHANHASQ